VALEGVTVEAGGRERNLGVVVSELDADSFADPEELYDDLVAALDDAGAGGA
jgi:hypothetical protein